MHTPRTCHAHAKHMPCTHLTHAISPYAPGASKPDDLRVEVEAPGKQIDESPPVNSAPEKAAPPPPSAAPAAKAAPASSPVPSSAAPAPAALPGRAAEYAPAAPEGGDSPLIARITINENVEATVAIMTEIEAAETGNTSRESEEKAGAQAETHAEVGAEESKPPSQRSPTDEMSEAEIAEATALDEEFKKEVRERKEQYEATTKVSRKYSSSEWSVVSSKGAQGAVRPGLGSTPQLGLASAPT